MKVNSIKALIRKLVEVEPSKSPMLSCFVTFDSSRGEGLAKLDFEFQMVSRKLAGTWYEDFQKARTSINDYLKQNLKADTQSVVIYARAGKDPFFEALQFKVPLLTEIIVDSLSHIYPLIELKDNYHRFVIVITTEAEAQILETTIGSVTEEIMTARPELRNRIGREWTREHYRNHKHEREQQFIKEKIKIVEDLMKRRGHNHLIVAGSPKMVSRLTDALPHHLKNKLLSTMANNPTNGLGALLRNCILEFSTAENLESHDRVKILESAVLSNGLGLTGFEPTKDAITGGYADMLIIDQDFSDFDGREELVRLATKFNIQIETVNDSPTLKRLGGVGCLLRYQPNFLKTGTKYVYRDSPSKY